MYLLRLEIAVDTRVEPRPFPIKCAACRPCARHAGSAPSRERRHAAHNMARTFKRLTLPRKSCVEVVAANVVFAFRNRFDVWEAHVLGQRCEHLLQAQCGLLARVSRTQSALHLRWQ